MANLLQVSSAFGRAMESVDRQRMALTLYPELQALLADGWLDPDGAARAVAACAEGYAFPTNLDRDPPLGGLAPESPQVVMRRALQEARSPEQFQHQMRTLADRRLS
jgi:hypothetical protein